MITCPAWRPDTRDLVEGFQHAEAWLPGLAVDALRGGVGCDHCFDAFGHPVDIFVEGVDLMQQDTGQFRVVIIETAGESLNKFPVFDLQPSTSKFCQGDRVSFTGDECFDHRPTRHSKDVRCDSGKFDQRVFEEFLHALLVSGAFIDQIRPHPSEITQTANLDGWHERRPKHAAFIQLRKPDRVDPVGLWAAWDLFHVTRVDQPRCEPGGFEQIHELGRQ